MPTPQPQLTYPPLLDWLRELLQAPSSTPPRTHVQHLLEALMRHDPAITQAALYLHDTKQAYHVWVSQGSAQTLPDIAELDEPIRQAIAQHEVRFIESESMLVAWIPLWDNTDTLGVLRLVLDAKNTAVQTLRDRVAGFGPPLSLTLGYLLIRYRSHVEAAIYEAQSSARLLQAAYTELAPPPDELKVELVELDIDNEPAAFITYAIVTADDLHEEQIRTNPADHNLGPYLDTLGRGIPVLINDLQTDARLPDSAHPHFAARGIRALGAFPAHLDGQLVSIITAAYTAPHVFTALEINALQQISLQIGLGVHHRWTQMQARERNYPQRLLESLQHVSGQISASLTGAGALQSLCQTMAQALSVDYAAIIRFDQVPGMGNIAAEAPAHLGPETLFMLEGFRVYERLQQHERVTVPDTTADPSLLRPHQAQFEALGMRSLLFVPLVVQNDMIGALLLAVKNAPRQLTPAEMHTVNIVASQLALGLRNTELFVEVQRRANQLEQIAAFGRAVTSTFNQDEILQRVRDVLPRLLPIDHAELALHSHDDSHLRTFSLIDGSNQQEVSKPAAGTSIAEITQTHMPLLVSDLSQSTYTDHQALAAEGLCTALFTPLTTGRTTIGVLSIAHKQPHIYTVTDLTLFQQIGNRVAIAFENARLFQAAQKRASYEEVLSEITSGFQNQTDLHDLLYQTAHDLGQVLGARRARVRLQTDLESNRPQASAYLEE